MSGWTIHSTHGQLDPRECIRFNPCQERQSASWVPFHPTHELFCSCSLQYSEPSLASVLYSLLRVFFFLFFFFLPFIPSGCSGSSISSVMGSVFSQALSSLVEHPAQTRSHGYSPGEESGKTGNKRRRGEHSLLPELESTAPSEGQVDTARTSPEEGSANLWPVGCEVPTGSGEKGCLPEVWFGNRWWAQRDFCTRSFTYPQVKPTMSEIMIKKKIKIRIDFKMG